MALITVSPEGRRKLPAGPPEINAAGVLAWLGGGAFSVDYEKVDARVLEQLHEYAAFVGTRYPGWKIRIQTAPQKDAVGVRMFVFPVRMAPSFMAAWRNYVVHRR